MRRPPQLLFLVLLYIFHVQVPDRLDLVLVHLDRQRPIRRRQLAVFGKIRTTSVRRLISSFSRSSRFVDFMFLWCCRYSAFGSSLLSFLSTPNGTVKGFA